MKLYEYRGKEIFAAYGIPVPRGVLVHTAAQIPQNLEASVAKAQLLSGDRMRAGGILIGTTPEETKAYALALLGTTIRNEVVESVLIEEKISATDEYYISISYSDDHGGPVLSLSAKGGTGTSEAYVHTIDITAGLSGDEIMRALSSAKFLPTDIDGVSDIAVRLWKLFIDEHAILAEINPLFKTHEGTFVAGDAKIILDDEAVQPGERRYIEMSGDIAILASGGGASMLNMDALLRAGGKPANYTEYSGNPPAEEVKQLTLRTLSRPGLRGCWVVGAAANFTDIHTTLSGLLEGLREVSPKPNYPIVIRRDGPRRDEAFAMLREAGAKEGFDFHLFDSETPMIETAKTMVALAYADKK